MKKEELINRLNKILEIINNEDITKGFWGMSSELGDELERVSQIEECIIKLLQDIKEE